MNDKALACIPRSLPEVRELADLLSKSNLLPEALRGKIPDIAMQILTGQELGLSPTAAIRGVHIVQGKPLLSADMMVGLVLGSGAAEYFSCIEETATQVTYETKRKGSPHPQRCTWSDDDTKAAGLQAKDNWRLHKRQMRRARCKAMLARDVFPDVLAGVYDPDEIHEPARAEATPMPVGDVIDAEFTDQLSLSDRIRAAVDLDALKALAPECNKLPKDSAERNQMRAEYQARQQELVKIATAPLVTETAA
jgi:hypothetical protein